MIAAPIGPDEPARLAALRRLRVLDTPNEKIFDDLTALAAGICETPTSLVSLIDLERQWFKSNFGGHVGGGARETSFCAHVVSVREYLEIGDTHLDARFVDNPSVVERPFIRFYAGAPLTTIDGHAVGTLCVIDTQPRQLSESQRSALQMLSRQVTELLELRANAASAAIERENLNAILENLGEGVMVLDDAGVVNDANQAAAAIFEVPATKLAGRSLTDLIGERARQAVAEALDSGTVLTDTYLLNSERGDGRWVSLTLNPFVSGLEPGDGRLLGTVRDITELKQKELNLIYSAKMASLGQMASGMAHEINNPLSIISAAAGDLILQAERSQLSSEDAVRAGRRIEETATRIAKIVRGLRTFSRSSENDPMFPVALRQIVDETIGLCRDRFVSNNVTLDVDVPADLVALCRLTQVTQVLLNLLNNALDATESTTERWVTLRACALKGRLFICVTDSGPQIPLEIRARVMEPFFTTKPVGRGTGLGLSISRGLVEAHGGTLKLVEERPNTTFAFDLTLAT